jgi:CHAT domain
MTSLIAAIQDAPSAREVDARTVLRSTPEPIVAEPDLAGPEVLTQFNATATVRAARSYALLTVHRVDDEHFRLSGGHSEESIALPLGEPRGRPRLSLGELASGRRVGGADFKPENLYRLMWVWSQKAPELIEWLQGLRAKVGDDELRLVIWDTTGFDIPWELLHLPSGASPECPQGPLGGIMAVSRSVTVHQAMIEGSPYTDHACRGRLLAYVEEEMAADREFLPGYAAGAVRNLNELLDQLESAQDSLGLVYVACHGYYADELSELLLGNVQYYDIAMYPLAALSRSRALVFLNACHAARLLWDPRINSDVYGFARAFLQGGADVVIGPTGLVEGHPTAQPIRRSGTDRGSREDRATCSREAASRRGGPEGTYLHVHVRLLRKPICDS